jgi:hypothetical protein
MGLNSGQAGEPRMFVQGLNDESAVKLQRYGTIRRTDDGRIYRYAGFTAANLVAGHCVSKVQTSIAATVAAADAALAVVDANEISLTVAGVTKNLLADGWLVLTAGTGIGEIYKIRGNGATDGIASGRASISLYDKVRVAFVAASTTARVYANPYADLLINPAVANEAATTAETVLGVCPRAFTASYFGWIQTHGPCGVVLDTSTAGNEADERAVMPGTTAGHGIVITGMTVLQVIGYTFEKIDQVNAEGTLVNLCID